MQAAFIVNNRIKHKRRFSNLLAEIEHAKLFENYTVQHTNHAGHAISLAERATEKMDLVVAVGGDGTLNEVLNGFMIGSQFRVGKSAPVLAYLPFGTANDFARSAGIKADAAQFIDLIEHNRTEEIDIGKIRYETIDGDEEERYFINIADAGIGGQVVQKVNNSRTKKLLGGNITFMRAIGEALLTYELSNVKVLADSFEWEGKLLSLVCANGRYFGNGLCIAPNAHIKDGHFDVAILSEFSAADYAKHLIKLRKGEKIDHPQLHYFTAKEIEVTPDKYSCSIESDGEFVGNVPMRVSLLPSELTFLMPHIALSEAPPAAE